MTEYKEFRVGGSNGPFGFLGPLLILAVFFTILFFCGQRGLLAAFMGGTCAAHSHFLELPPVNKKKEPVRQPQSNDYDEMFK